MRSIIEARGRFPTIAWKRYLKTAGANIFYLMRERLNDPKLSYDFVRSDVVLNTQVNIVDIADGSDNPIRVYFDANSKWPLRQESSAWDPVGRGRSTERTDYSKYRGRKRSAVAVRHSSRAEWRSDIRHVRQQR